MAGFGFNQGLSGDGFQWRGLGEFRSYLDEQGQGRGKGGGRETEEEVTGWRRPCGRRSGPRIRRWHWAEVRPVIWRRW